MCSVYKLMICSLFVSWMLCSVCIPNETKSDRRREPSQLTPSHNSHPHTTHTLTQLTPSHNSHPHTTHTLTQLTPSHNSHLHRCTPVDLILIHSDVTITCLECGRENSTSGLNYGTHKDSWCRRCHTKLSVFVEQCRFVQHQAGAGPSSAECSTSAKKSIKKREPLIQVGKPLPELGTCGHYKKSHRWLR